MATRRAAAKATEERRGGKPARSARPRGTAQRAPREFRDAVLLEKTGRTRTQWFAILDAYDCRAKGHTASAAHLLKRYRVSPWWSQAITVEYERARGIRSVGERADGFAFTVQRALAVNWDVAWDALVVTQEIQRWRGVSHRQQFREGGRWSNADGDRGAFRRIEEGRFLRTSWENKARAPGSVVEVEILDRGEQRSLVKLTHRRIRSSEESEDLRAHWSWVLDSFKSYVETGEPIPLAAWLAARS